MTGGRLKRVARYLENDDTFLLTYGDGLSNVNISGLLDFHRQHGRLATVTSVPPDFALRSARSRRSRARSSASWKSRKRTV